jgi:Superinfection immunity protein
MKIKKLYLAFSLLFICFMNGQSVENSLPFENNEITIEKIMAGMFGLAIYFIPTIISRDKKKWKIISIFNLLTGWTGIGWLISLVWALKAESKISTDLDSEEETESEENT